MEWETKWISKQRLLTLQLESIGLEGGSVHFIFKDNKNNFYEHYQVPPSIAASYSKANQFFSNISGGQVRLLDCTELTEHLLEPLQKFCGNYYACCCRKRVMDSNRVYLNVESLFYPFPVPKTSFDVEVKDCWVEDGVELARLSKKYEKSLKTRKDGTKILIENNIF